MSNLDLQIEAQASDAVEEFTLFPKLPVELRLKIWRTSFPSPRPVNLGFLYRELDSTPESSKLSQYERMSMLPEALSVNHESRVEALRHFAIVLRENFPDQDNQEKQQHPTCLNVSKDFAYFSAAAMEDWGRFFWGWIRDIKGAQPSSGAKIIDDIRVLHVRHFEWNEEIKAGYTDNLKFEKTHGLEEVLLGGILQFSGLRKVVFTGCDVMMREMSKEIEASAKEFIQEFLEGHKHMFASKEAPEIVVQGWKALLKPEDEEEILSALSRGRRRRIVDGE